MVKYLSRKFIAWVTTMVILTVLLILALAHNGGIVGPAVMVAYATLIITNTFAYLGGNVWSSWVKSKYFLPEDKK